MAVFDKIKESVKRNKEVATRLIVEGISTAGLTAAEIAGAATLMDKICEGVDEEHPATFGQTFGTVLVSLLGTGAAMATSMAGVTLMMTDFEDHWITEDDVEFHNEFDEED